MNLGLFNASQIGRVSHALLGELRRIVSAIGTWADVEHNADGTHKNTLSIDGAIVGQWTTPPFVAANFTATGGTLTVAAADRVTERYTIINRTMFYTVSLADITTASAPSALHLTIPDGRVAAVTVALPYGRANAALIGAEGAVAVATTAGSPTITVTKFDASDFADTSSGELDMCLPLEIEDE